MANRVNLDAMIPREDFEVEDGEFAVDLVQQFPLSYLAMGSSFQKLLRKPDFQRETNHWSPEQIATFIASFLDNEVVPSLIFWKAPTYIFVIDGGHRLSALRSWIEDDYGDGALSKTFYGGEIPMEQKRSAQRARILIERRIGRYANLKKLADSKGSDTESKRANRMTTRGLTLQWVQGSPALAESSFYKINSQGTPLDDVERMLIENRRKPIAIGARYVLRGGSGHSYWSAFTSREAVSKIQTLGKKFHDLLFEPESSEPLRTMDVPVGGSVSPVDALSLLIDFLTIASSREVPTKTISEYADDGVGDETAQVLARALEVLNRMTGSSNGSLGLHTAVYFYNERAKHSRFLFLGFAALIAEKLRNNDTYFFKKFTYARSKIEDFLIENKSLIGIVLQNLAKGQRVPKMKEMFDLLIATVMVGASLEVTTVISQLGMKGRILDVTTTQLSPTITDETKASLLIRASISSAKRCPLCNGRMEINKSVSYDHITDRKYDGTGDIDNVQMAHPYCNNSKDSLLREAEVG